MTTEIAVSDDRRYIKLTIVGEITAETALKNNLDAYRLGNKLGIHRYFVDAKKARNTDSILNQHKFANKDMPMNENIDKNARVAVLISKGDTSHFFIETVMHNAGFNLKLFDDMDNALHFLLND